MADPRTNEVVMAVIGAMREAMVEKGVTFPEYRAAIGHIMKTAEAGELPLMIDVFFNTTIVEAINNRSVGSPSDLEGPYFIEDIDWTDGDAVERLEDDSAQPLLVHGKVTAPDGSPLENATVFIWSSTPDGRYGGIHPGVPKDAYRAKLKTDANGSYRIETSVPIPYQIPHHGPTGELLNAIGRHSWRPAHVHFKVRAEGYEELTTQAYFSDDDYLRSDCCEGTVADELIFDPANEQEGKRAMEVNLTLNPAHAMAEA